jgi:uncharacterized protein YfkK (UPF0435 family)
MFLFLSMGLYPSDRLLLFDMFFFLMLKKRNMSIREVGLRDIIPCSKRRTCQIREVDLRDIILMLKKRNMSIREVGLRI